jgi:tetratricopeptide (TPR) repeat protein
MYGMRSIVFLGLLFVLPFSAWGQGSTTAGAKASDNSAKTDKYAAESVVHERANTLYRYAADGTGLREITLVSRMQSEAAARQFGVVVFPFAGNNERVEIEYVRVRKPDGTIVETPVSDAQEMPLEVTRQAPFYSDLKEKQIPVRNLRMGDKLEYKARIIHTKPEVPGEFWGQESFGYGSTGQVMLEETVELRVPKDKYVKVWSPKYTPVITDESGETVYRWKSAQLEPTVKPDGKANTREVDPDGELPSIAWTTFKSWQDVGTWYQSLESDRIVADADVKAKVAELIAGKTTDEEKVRALYGYVALQIRYIGVAFGIGRFQPHPAGEVLRNQYGDCKDKHTLLAAMLREAGLHPQAVLIGAGIRFNEDVPSPSAFNHAITTLPVAGKQVWLDSTAEVAPYQLLVPAIRDKQALVIPENSAAKLERTPAATPFPFVETFVATGTLNSDGTMKAHMELVARGDDELAMRALFRMIAPGQWEQFTQRFSEGIGFSGTTSHTEASRADATEEPFKLSYDYEKEKYSDWDNYKILPLFPITYLPSVDEKEPPKTAPIELGSPRVELARTVIKLPAGWGAESPKDIHEKTAFASFDKTYKIDHDTLTVERRIEVLQKRVPAADWKAYKKWCDATIADNEKYIQLTTTGRNAGEKGPPMQGPADQTGANVLRMASLALQRQDAKAARGELDLLKASNPSQVGLWRMYAAVDVMENHPDAAVQDFKHELTAHPDQTDLYTRIIQMQLQQKHRSDAEQTLRDQVKAMPEIMPPALWLAELLMEDGNATEAAAVLKAAAARAPTDKLHPYVLVKMGIAEIRAGKRDEGVATLTSVLKDSDEPYTLNDAAYELADQNIELDLAETSARKAVDALTAESAKWTLDGDAKQQATKSSMLIASWDTMGWVLFRKGKVEEAEEYVKAAWLNNGHAAEGLHLGQIEEAKGDKRTALNVYQIAHLNQGTQSVSDELKRRIDSLQKAGVTPLRHEEASGISKMQMLKADDPDHAKGIADYEILISADQVVEVTPTPDAATKIDNGLAKVRSISFKGWTPSGSSAKIRIRGLLNCGHDTCVLQRLPI